MFNTERIPKRLWVVIWIIALFVIYVVVMPIYSYVDYMYFGGGRMYDLGSKLEYMHIENIQCRLDASQARNECIQEVTAGLAAGDVVSGDLVRKCDDVGNTMFDDCHRAIDWESIRRINQENN